MLGAFLLANIALNAWGVYAAPNDHGRLVRRDDGDCMDDGCFTAGVIRSVFWKPACVAIMTAVVTPCTLTITQTPKIVTSRITTTLTNTYTSEATTIVTSYIVKTFTKTATSVAKVTVSARIMIDKRSDGILDGGSAETPAMRSKRDGETSACAAVTSSPNEILGLWDDCGDADYFSSVCACSGYPAAITTLKQSTVIIKTTPTFYTTFTKTEPAVTTNIRTATIPTSSAKTVVTTSIRNITTTVYYFAKSSSSTSLSSLLSTSSNFTTLFGSSTANSSTSSTSSTLWSSSFNATSTMSTTSSTSSLLSSTSSSSAPPAATSLALTPSDRFVLQITESSDFADMYVTANDGSSGYNGGNLYLSPTYDSGSVLTMDSFGRMLFVRDQVYMQFSTAYPNIDRIVRGGDPRGFGVFLPLYCDFDGFELYCRETSTGATMFLTCPSYAASYSWPASSLMFSSNPNLLDKGCNYVGLRVRKLSDIPAPVTGVAVPGVPSSSTSPPSSSCTSFVLQVMSGAYTGKYLTYNYDINGGPPFLTSQYNINSILDQDADGRLHFTNTVLTIQFNFQSSLDITRLVAYNTNGYDNLRPIFCRNTGASGGVITCREPNSGASTFVVCPNLARNFGWVASSVVFTNDPYRSDFGCTPYIFRSINTCNLPPAGNAPAQPA